LPSSGVAVNVTASPVQKVSPVAELLSVVVTVADKFEGLVSYKGNDSKSLKIKIMGDRQSAM
tara:strand:+ start:3254 stop:3439 length:186 start_codon:yes stop_codon:yes gene_type:complete